MNESLVDSPKTYSLEEVSRVLEHCNIRRALSSLRQKWDAHGPASPICLAEPVDTNLTASEFCVLFLLAQRSRRNGVSMSRSEE